MNKWIIIFLFCTCSVDSFAQDVRLRFRPSSAQYEVVSEDDIKQLSANGATLDALKGKLVEIDNKLDKIQSTLDKDVLPTIHVMDFFKWLLGAFIVAIISVVVNDLWRNRRTPAAS